MQFIEGVEGQIFLFYGAMMINDGILKLKKGQHLFAVPFFIARYFCIAQNLSKFAGMCCLKQGYGHA